MGKREREGEAGWRGYHRTVRLGIAGPHSTSPLVAEKLLFKEGAREKKTHRHVSSPCTGE